MIWLVNLISKNKFDLQKFFVSKTVLILLFIFIYPYNSKSFGRDNFENTFILKNDQNKEKALSEINNLVKKVEKLYDSNEYLKSITLLKEILFLEKKFLGENHLDVAGTLDWLGNSYFALEQYSEAKEYFNQSLRIFEKSLAKNTIEYLSTLRSLGVSYHELNQLSKAELIYLDVIQLQEDNSFTKIFDSHNTFYNLGRLYQDKFLYKKSEEFFQKAIENIEKIYNKEIEDYFITLDSLGDLNKEQGFFKQAEPFFLKARKINKKFYGNDSNDDYLRISTNLANLYLEMGLYRKSENLFLEILNKRIDSKENTSSTLNNLGLLYQDQGNYVKAKDFLVKAMEIDKKRYGENSKEYASSLNNLALNFVRQGKYKKAEELYLQSIEIIERLKGNEDPSLAKRLNNLAVLYQNMGFFSKAEPLYMRSLEIDEKSFGRNHPNTAISLNNLGLMYFLQGINDRAEPLLIESLNINKKFYGKYHPKTSTSLNNLSLVYENKKSIPLLKESLKITSKIFGKEHPDTATALNNLAMSYYENSQFEKAEEFLNESIKIDQKFLDENHPKLAISLSNLGLIYKDQGYFKKSEKSLLDSLSIRKSLFGLENEETSANLIDLGELYKENKDFLKAHSSIRKGVEIFANLIQREAPFIPIADRVKYIESFNYGFEAAISSAFESNTGTELAFFARLNRQGLLEEIEKRQSLKTKFLDSEIILIDRLRHITEKLSSKNINKKQIKILRKERDNIEKEIYRLIPKLQPRIVQIEQVANNLPENSILIEYQRYLPSRNDFNKNPIKERYLAFILYPDRTYKVVDLVAADLLDNKIKNALISSEQSYSDSQELWNEVSKEIIKPLKKYIDNSSTLFISPDSEIHRVPFMALKSTNQINFLSEIYNLRLLTTGREIIDLNINSKVSKQRPLIIANPSFDKSAGLFKQNINIKNKFNNSQYRSFYLNNTNWKSLPGTQKEGITISKIINGELLTQEAATASNIQSRESAKIIHIASHAYYIPNEQKEISPLLKSGIVLTGANSSFSEGFDDGYLTSLEISKLDWVGTEMVVISACDSGLGEIKSGEGIYGLKRAITVAGARSSLLSLWEVNDKATAAFMESFYKKLKEGEGRSNALASTQNEFRVHPNEDWRHPNVWAAFQLSGDWRPISF